MRKVQARTPSVVCGVLCALTLPLCVLVCRPFVETGMLDDWSCIKTAQLLAQTGHIVYNGYMAPMLGWMLYPAAWCIRLFGFSFTAARMSTVLVAMANAFLLHRIFLRIGVRTWNATLGTLTVVLSPVVLALTFSLMSDIAGLFSVMLCLYACLRALQAEKLWACHAWIVFAALSNAVGGTARQIAWVGVLVMVPSAIWLLRRRRGMLLTGALSVLAGLAIIVASLHWYNAQMYSDPDKIVLTGGFLLAVKTSFFNVVFAVTAMLSWLLPMTLVFTVGVWRGKRRTSMVFGACIGALLLAWAGMHFGHFLSGWRPPFLDPYLSTRGILNAQPEMMGKRPEIMSNTVRVLYVAATMTGAAAVFAVVSGRERLTAVTMPVEEIAWPDLLTLIVPAGGVYLGLMLPRAAMNECSDRYMMLPFVLCVLLIVRCFQDRVSQRLPYIAAVLVLMMTVFSVAAVHDVFSLYRGILAATDELRTRGVPRRAINANWDYNGWTEIELVGHVNDLKVVNPRGAYVPQPTSHEGGNCDWSYRELTPELEPEFILSFTPKACGGLADVPPVVYYTWLAPHATSIYVLKYPERRE
jgi:hypothetical protein